jgi:hypothetical protein
MKLPNEICGERAISTNVWPPRSPDLTLPEFYLWGAAQSPVYRDRPRTLNELKTAITAYVRNISQADLQKEFANKIKRVQACIDARGHHFFFYLCKIITTRASPLGIPRDICRGRHHFQNLLRMHSDFPNALYNCNITHFASAFIFIQI